MSINEGYILRVLKKGYDLSPCVETSQCLTYVELERFSEGFPEEKIRSEYLSHIVECKNCAYSLKLILRAKKVLVDQL